MVRQRAHRNEGSRGAPAGSTRQSSRLKDCSHAPIYFFSGRKFELYQHRSSHALEHAPIRFAFILAFMGAQTDTLQWGQISCSLLYLLRSIESLEQFGTRSRSSYERACWIGDFRFVFVFVFSCLYTKLKKQYSTANTVLFLPLTPKKQYRTALT